MFKTVQTIELSGAALDWAVSKCEGYRRDVDISDVFTPSRDWAHGGPIIDRWELDLNKTGLRTWRAKTVSLGRYYDALGPTPLIAAMRCYVKAKLGETIEVPSELLEGV